MKPRMKKEQALHLIIIAFNIGVAVGAVIASLIN